MSLVVMTPAEAAALPQALGIVRILRREAAKDPRARARFMSGGDELIVRLRGVSVLSAGYAADLIEGVLADQKRAA